MCIKIEIGGVGETEEGGGGGEQPPQEEYYTIGDVYRKEFELTPTESVTTDTDYRDGKVTYLKLVYGVYTTTSVALKEEVVDLDSVTAGVPIPVVVTYEVTSNTPQGKLIALASLLKIDGTYDKVKRTWKWDIDILAKDGDGFTVRW